MSPIKEHLLKTALSHPARRDIAKRIADKIEQQVEDGGIEVLLITYPPTDEYGYRSLIPRDELYTIRLYCALAELPITHIQKVDDEIWVTVSLIPSLKIDD